MNGSSDALFSLSVFILRPCRDFQRYSELQRSWSENHRLEATVEQK